MSIISEELKKLTNEQLILKALKELLSEINTIHSIGIRDEICERVAKGKDNEAR